MRVIRVTRPSGPGGLKPAEAPAPEPAAGQVLVRVEWAGVNFIDTYRRSGVYRVAFPHVPGSEGAGRVLALGGEAREFEVGQAVAWATSATGSYAEQALVDADQLLAVPEELPLDVAAALPLQGMTADYLARSCHRLEAGETALVLAAAGGVGQLLTQMALAEGARVIATVGAAAKIPAVHALGVAPGDVIDLGAFADVADSLPQAVRDLTDGRGVDVVYDGVGRDTFPATLASLAPRGQAVLYGGASGQVPPFDPQELNAHGSLYLTRPKLDDYTATRAELLERAGRVFTAAVSGRLKVGIGGRHPLADAQLAHEGIESGASQGKILLFNEPIP
jgi:NADPH2:quinone reductase